MALVHDHRRPTTRESSWPATSPLLLAPVGVIGTCTDDDHGDLTAARASALTQVPSGDLPVLFDSGVRSGVDVVKALALGATAVGVVRPRST